MKLKFANFIFTEALTEKFQSYGICAEVYSALSSAILGGWWGICGTGGSPLSGVLLPPGGEHY